MYNTITFFVLTNSAMNSAVPSIDKMKMLSTLHVFSHIILPAPIHLLEILPFPAIPKKLIR